MADFYNDEETCRAFREMPYQEYLQTPWWRRRRDRYIRQVGSKCERCGGRTPLDVHHKTEDAYKRLGAERDSDLEALCRTCHQGHHVDETRRHNLGVYLKLASETIRLDQPTNVTDFKVQLRERCKRLNLPLDRRIDDAITATQGRLSLVTPARREEVDRLAHVLPELPPIDKQEALAICRRLNLRPIPVKSMPEPYGTGAGVAAIKARAMARLRDARCPQCQLQAAKVSRVEAGSLFCTGCHHHWPIPLERSP